MAALDGLYGALGHATAQDRQRLYGAQTGALSSQIGRSAADAQRAAMGGAATQGAGGNPFLAARLGAQAAGDAAQRVQSAGLAQQEQLGAQQQAQELQARQQQGQWAQQAIGGLLGAGGQVLGMAVPAFGALGGPRAVSGVASGLLGGSTSGQYPNSPVMGGYAGSVTGGLGGSSGPPAPLGGYDPATGIAGAFGTGLGPSTATGISGSTGHAGQRWDPQLMQWVPQ